MSLTSQFVALDPATFSIETTHQVFINTENRRSFLGRYAPAFSGSHHFLPIETAQGQCGAVWPWRAQSVHFSLFDSPELDHPDPRIHVPAAGTVDRFPECLPSTADAGKLVSVLSGLRRPDTRAFILSHHRH